MSNNLNQDLTGEVVIVEGYSDTHFKCKTGFGCKPDTSGTKIFGYWLSDGQHDHIKGYDVKSIVR